MDRILSFLFFSALFSIQHGASMGMESIYKTMCSHKKTIISCPEFHKIAIKRLYYGVKRNKLCSMENKTQYSISEECCKAGPKDCIVLEDSKYPLFNIQCSGYRHCPAKANVADPKDKCQFSSHKETNYMTVVYDCVPVGDIIELCSSGSKRGKVLYLSNMNYPSPISKGVHNCSCLVQTGFTKGIAIHAIDVVLDGTEYNSRHCPQQLDIEDSNGNKKSISCGMTGLYGFRMIYKHLSHNVSVTLKSNSINQRGFVWLQVKAISNDDYVSIFCGNSIQQSHYPGKATSKTKGSNSVDETEDKSRDRNNSLKLGNLGFVIGGAATAIILVFIISLITILVYCNWMRKKKKQAKKMDLYSPAGLRKTDDLYGSYDYNEDHYISIRRSPMKVSTYSNLQVLADQKLREAFQPTEYKEDVNGSRRFSDPLTPASPEGRRAGILSNYQGSNYANVTFVNPSSSKPPTRTKSKSVSFSQPVAMVTPLHSASEESVEHSDNEDGVCPLGDSNYKFKRECENTHPNSYSRTCTDIAQPSSVEDEEASLSTFLQCGDAYQQQNNEPCEQATPVNKLYHDNHRQILQNHYNYKTKYELNERPHSKWNETQDHIVENDTCANAI